MKITNNTKMNLQIYTEQEQGEANGTCGVLISGETDEYPNDKIFVINEIENDI